MKPQLISIILISLSMICIQSATCMQDVGGDFGTSWLENYGTKPVSVAESHKNLWEWGNVPKGYKMSNGILYPPGYWPMWYYPTFPKNETPIVINNSIVDNYLSPTLQSSRYADPWLLSQLSGRPVAVLNEPNGPLF